MILKDFLMGDFNGDKIHLHSEVHKENSQDLSPPEKKSNTVFLNNYIHKNLISPRKEPNKQNKTSNTIQFTEERYQVHIHSMSQSVSVLMEKKKSHQPPTPLKTLILIQHSGTPCLESEVQELYRLKANKEHNLH